MESDDLARRRDNLEGSIDSLAVWMIVFTAAVVIGLLIEFCAILAFIRIHEWWVVLDAAGEATVTVGVGGELWVEFRASRKEKKLRGINAEIERQDKLTIANLNLVVEQERHARVKIEKYVAGCDVSPEKELAICKGLSAFANSERLVIITPGFDGFEARRFGSLLCATLKQAKLNAFTMAHEPLNPIREQGVYILATPDPETQELAVAIGRSLKGAGIEADWYTTSDNDPEELKSNWPPAWYDPRRRRVLIVVMEQPRPELPQAEEPNSN